MPRGIAAESAGTPTQAGSVARQVCNRQYDDLPSCWCRFVIDAWLSAKATVCVCVCVGGGPVQVAARPPVVRQLADPAVAGTRTGTGGRGEGLNWEGLNWCHTPGQTPRRSECHAVPSAVYAGRVGGVYAGRVGGVYAGRVGCMLVERGVFPRLSPPTPRRRDCLRGSWGFLCAKVGMGPGERHGPCCGVVLPCASLPESVTTHPPRTHPHPPPPRLLLLSCVLRLAASRVFQWDGGLDLGLGYGDGKSDQGPFELPTSLRPGDSLLAQLPPGFKVNMVVEEQYGARTASSSTRKTPGAGGAGAGASGGGGRDRASVGSGAGGSRSHSRGRGGAAGAAGEEKEKKEKEREGRGTARYGWSVCFVGD
jgi:hypothetical protein